MTRFQIIISNNENVLQQCFILITYIQRVSKRMTRFQIIISNNENVLQQCFILITYTQRV